jgi:hypothetical protein
MNRNLKQEETWMIHKTFEKFLVSALIRKIQIQTIAWYH